MAEIYAAPQAVKLVSNFIQHMDAMYPSWNKAYYRFQGNADGVISNASYVSGHTVELLSPFDSGADDFYESMMMASQELLKTSGYEQGILLVVVSDDRKYEILYEPSDMGRWKISKADGGSGIPKGLR